MALSPDEQSLPKVREFAEKRFGGPGFGLTEGGLIGTAPRIVERLRHWQDLGFGQVVLFTHDRASDRTLELLAGEVISEFSR